MATTIELTPTALQGLCKRYLKKEYSLCSSDKDANAPKYTFQVLDYKLKATSDAPAGFLGRHQFLSVEILVKNETTQTEQQHHLSFFTKSAPSDVSSRMEYVEEFGVFKKEILVFRTVIPQLQKIFANFAAKCYYADNNLLVFENLSEQGYKMGAARDGLLNYEHLNCALKALAAMHASSIVYEVRKGKKISEMHAEAIEENAYPTHIENYVRRKNFTQGTAVFKEIVKTIPKYQENLNFILTEIPKRMEYIYEMAKTSTKYQNVFCHADLWANNLMFQYGRFGQTPLQCRMVDFQLLRYAPPMIDLITILTIPTSRDFRELYLVELWQNYYRYMTEFLKRENLNINDFLPQKQFTDSLNEFRLCGLIESILFSHLTILPTEATKSLTTTAEGFTDFFENKRVEICMEVFHTDHVYKERLTDMIEDFVDNFVLL